MPKPKPSVQIPRHKLTVKEARDLGIAADRERVTKDNAIRIKAEKVAANEKRNAKQAEKLSQQVKDAEAIARAAERAATKAAEASASAKAEKAEARKAAKALAKAQSTWSSDKDDPVERSETYTANLITPQQTALEAKARMNRLRELIEPNTEAMVKVMMDIATDKAHLADPQNVKSIHASIRLEAADRVLSRAYGKPKEHVVVEDPADAAGAGDEVMKLLGNIFEAVGLPPLLEGPKPEDNVSSS